QPLKQCTILRDEIAFENDAPFSGNRRRNHRVRKEAFGISTEQQDAGIRRLFRSILFLGQQADLAHQWLELIRCETTALKFLAVLPKGYQRQVCIDISPDRPFTYLVIKAISGFGNWKCN